MPLKREVLLEMKFINLEPKLSLKYSIVSPQLLKVVLDDYVYLYTAFQNPHYKEVVQRFEDCFDGGKFPSDEPDPETLVYSIFYRGTDGTLQVNSVLLDSIANKTTRANSIYLLALEKYGEEYQYDDYWSIDERSKIKAYIFNITYPLRKKYWSDRFEEWYNGTPEELLGTGSIWRDNNYYGLPDLEKYEDDFRSTYWSDSEI